MESSNQNNQNPSQESPQFDQQAQYSQQAPEQYDGQWQTAQGGQPYPSQYDPNAAQGYSNYGDPQGWNNQGGGYAYGQPGVVGGDYQQGWSNNSTVSQASWLQSFLNSPFACVNLNRTGSAHWLVTFGIALALVLSSLYKMLNIGSDFKVDSSSSAMDVLLDSTDIQLFVAIFGSLSMLSIVSGLIIALASLFVLSEFLWQIRMLLTRIAMNQNL